MIKEIAFTCYAVSSLSKARKFYEEILELKATNVWADGEMGFVEYDIGQGTFALGAGAENFKPSKEGASVAFEVDDFEKTIKKLKENSVPFVLEAHETPVCRMALITDPDGNKLMIHKRK